MASKNIGVKFAEDSFGKKFDGCVSNTLVKGGAGLILGSAISLLFLKRRSWPAIMGTGFGVGMACKSCEREFNS